MTVYSKRLLGRAAWIKLELVLPSGQAPAPGKGLVLVVEAGWQDQKKSSCYRTTRTKFGKACRSQERLPLVYCAKSLAVQPVLSESHIERSLWALSISLCRFDAVVGKSFELAEECP